MFINLLKVTFRNLLRNKSYAFINLFGLSVGIAATLLILIYILFEFSYDQFHKNSDTIFRISVIHKKAGNPEYESPVYTPPIGPAMKMDFPEVEDFVRISTPRSIFANSGESILRVNNVCYADTSFFNFFSFDLITGDPAKVLADPFSIVITESIAKRIFSDQDPMDKIVNLNQKDNFRVTGIVKDPPRNSTIRFNALISFSTLYHMGNTFMGWNGGNQYITFVRLNHSSDASRVKERLPDLMWRNINKGFADIKVFDEPYLQPLKKMHIYYDKVSGNKFFYILIFGAVAALILIMACVNFINLTTALSTTRAKEIGVRKVLGARKTDVIRQFLMESTFFSFFSLIIALILVEIFFPVFENLIGGKILLSSFLHFKYILSLLFITLFVGFVAGSYPAFFISSFQTVKIIKGVFDTKKGKQWSRNSLLVFQFVISLTLIICTVLIQKQLNYMNNKDLGFQKENIIVLPLPYKEVQQKSDLLKQGLSSLPEARNVSASSAVPISGFARNGYFPEGHQSPMMIHVVDVDENFLELFDIQIVNGRNFLKELKTDENAYLINERLAEILGWDQPIGKTIRRGSVHPVIGVVKDFNFATLYNKLEPLIITRRSNFSNLSVKVESKDIGQTLSSIESEWNRITAAAPFEYYFLDEAFDNLYKFETRFKNLFFSFCILALLISLLGLYSLSSFSTEQRSKEVAIRKVMGASSTNIIGMFSKDFIILVIIANLIAFPISWMIMNPLLQNFAYRISINIWVFILTGCLSTIIATLTIGAQTFKTAIANPVDSIRNE